MLASPHGPRCLAAEAVAEEIADHLPTLVSRRHLDLGLLLAAFQVMHVEWQEASIYEPLGKEADGRMRGRDPEDWPTVALALTLEVPIWSQDKDLEASGVAVYTTGDLLDALREGQNQAHLDLPVILV